MKRFLKYLTTFVAVAIVFYIAGYLVWSRIAESRSNELGLQGIFFVGYAIEQRRSEDSVRAFFKPVNYLDRKLLGGSSCGAFPTTTIE